jgi:hypothetical protein
MMDKKFEDYGFKPSAVIEGLNRWYSAGDKPSLIRFADPDGRPDHYYYFYDHNNVIDAAIKYLRSFDIFYTPGMKWDDVKFKLNSRACLAEYGFCDVQDAWPKVNPCFVGPRTERDKEILDYILKQADAAGIKIDIRDKSPEELIYYLISLLVRYRNDTKVERERADGYLDRLGCYRNDAKMERERADGYLEKIDRLQKELNDWDCWYNDKENYVK